MTIMKMCGQWENRLRKLGQKLEHYIINNWGGASCEKVHPSFGVTPTQAIRHLFA